MMASPSAIRPATCAVSTGVPVGSGEEYEIGSRTPLDLPGCGWLPTAGPGVVVGVIAGNRPEALPAPMSRLAPPFRLASPFRFGMGPGGNAGRFAMPGEDICGEGVCEALAEAGVGAEVTVTVSSAAGGVQCSVVTMLAVAVSFTELTEVALDATAICA